MRAVRPIQDATLTLSRWRHVVSAIGDSITFNTTLGVPPQDFWPEGLAVKLRDVGAACVARNVGISGNTSTQGLARRAALTHYEVPDIAIVALGINDPGNGINDATSRSNIVAIGQHAIDAGCSKVVIPTAHYLNWSGGDTVSAQNATYATVRANQTAARITLAAANPTKSVVLCDVFAHMRALISAGTYTQDDHLWHVADGDVHLNAAGEGIVADALLATIQAQDGWLDDLRAA